MSVSGLKRARANARRILTKGIPSKAARAAHVATSIIAGHASLMTPIETSNLINSQFKKVVKVNTGYVGIIGYSALYAIYVHEAPGKLKGVARPSGLGDYWAPNGSPKFLSKAALDNLPEIYSAIKKAMKI